MTPYRQKWLTKPSGDLVVLHPEDFIEETNTPPVCIKERTYKTTINIRKLQVMDMMKEASFFKGRRGLVWQESTHLKTPLCKLSGLLYYGKWLDGPIKE